MTKDLATHRQQAVRLVSMAVLALGGTLATTRAAVAQEAANAKWAVVQIDEETRVVDSSGVPDLRKKLETEWKEAVQNHADARKRAAKAKEKFEEPKPIKPVFKVLKDGLASEELANAALEELKAKGGSGKEKPGDSGGKASFIVVQAGTQHQVMEADNLKQFKEEAAARDKQALADYEESKKAAKKAGEEFTSEKPKKTSVKVVKKFDSEEEARKFLETLESGGREKDG